MEKGSYFRKLGQQIRTYNSTDKNRQAQRKLVANKSAISTSIVKQKLTSCLFFEVPTSKFHMLQSTPLATIWEHHMVARVLDEKSHISSNHGYLT